MPTVIDALYVTLGLDTSSFKKGTQEIEGVSAKLKRQLVDDGKGIEESVNKVGKNIDRVKNTILGLFSVLLAGRGFKEFIADVNASNLALANFSRNLSVDPRKVSELGILIERLGGNRDSAYTAYNAVNKINQDIATGKSYPDALARMIGANAEKGTPTPYDQRSPEASVQSLARILSQFKSYNENQEREFAKQLGLTDDLNLAMTTYGASLAKAEKEVERLAPTDQQLKATTDLVAAWHSMNEELSAIGEKVNRIFSPAFVGILNEITQVLGELNDSNVLKYSEHKVPDTGFHIGLTWDKKKNSPPEDWDKGLHPPVDDSMSHRLRKWLFGAADEADLPAAGAREASSLTANGEPISTGNPLPVILVKALADVTGGDFIDPLTGNPVGGGGGGGSGSGGGGGRGASGRGAAGGGGGQTQPGGSFGNAASKGEVQDFVRQAAIARGLNPDDMLRIVGGEGGFNPNWVGGGDDHSSFGPFQLHYGGISRRYPHSGLGDVFTKETGLSAKTNATWRQQVEWSMNYIAAHGFDPWKGSSSHSYLVGGPPRGSHVVPMHMPDDAFYKRPTEHDYTGAAGAAALNNIGASYNASTSSVSNSMHIGQLNVNAPNATDANGIAKEIPPALDRYGFGLWADTGPM